jgi:hypothetical protein
LGTSSSYVVVIPYPIMNTPSAPNSGNPPQFATAEYASASGAEVCKSCNQPISGSYFRVNGSLACSNCVGRLQKQLPTDTHARFMRGLLFGFGGAILGLILYSAFGIITGMEIGYLSLAVGYIVGKAIRMGSGGLGGRRYQIAAVLLTYFAVSMSAIPVGISMAMKEHREAKQAQSSPSGSVPESAKGTSQDPEERDITRDENSQPGALGLIGTLLFYGLASPFLALQDPFHGAIGIVILIVGVRIAWSLTAAPPVEILGPFEARKVTT